MPEGQELDLPALWMFGISGALFWASVILWVIWLIQRFQKKERPAHRPLRPWSIGWINFGIFICSIVCLMVVLQLLISILCGPLLERSDDTPGAWSMALGALTLQGAFLLAYCIGRKRFPMLFRGNLSSRPLFLLRALGCALPKFIRYMLLIGVVTYAWMALLELLVSLGVLDEFAPQQAVLIFSAGESPLALTVLALFAIILAPIAEEIVFRGCIYRFLKSKLPTGFAIFASGAFFACVHGNILALAPLTLVGCLLAYIYEKERNILVPICFHALFNFTTLLMTTLRALTDIELPY